MCRWWRCAHGIGYFDGNGRSAAGGWCASDAADEDKVKPAGNVPEARLQILGTYHPWPKAWCYKRCSRYRPVTLAVVTCDAATAAFKVRLNVPLVAVRDATQLP